MDMRKTAPLLAALGLAVATFGASGCSREDDPRDRVSRALDQANLDDVNVDWDHDAGLVRLKGEVDSANEKARAERIASSAAGASAKVVNELTVNDGHMGTTADDNDGNIERQIEQRIDADPQLKPRDIDVRVANGVVTLKGDLPAASDRARIEEMARGIAGVHDVVVANERKDAAPSPQH
jgi:osmotically-inducible protein OsmY